jgi:hypothetical protein
MTKPLISCIPWLAGALTLSLSACGASSAGRPATTSAEPPAGSSAPSAPAPPAPTGSATSAPAPTGAASVSPKSPPIDEAAVATATGGKPETSDGSVKVSFPRTDVPVDVDGAKLAPFLGLTSWAAFSPGKGGIEAMVMGDLVLFEDEVNPVMSALLDHGVEVTALHNHFFYVKPAVYFLHIGGEGTVASLGGGVKAALAKVAEIRKKSPKPAERSGAVALPAKSAIDGAKLDAIFGLKGAAKDGMYKATMGRAATAACGCPIGKVMGVNTWAAFQGSDDNASVDGDFAVTEGELQPVLKALRANGIEIVAIHSHMTGESPRLLFLHYWGRGKAADLATAVKRAVDLTAWEGRGKTG